MQNVLRDPFLTPFSGLSNQFYQSVCTSCGSLFLDSPVLATYRKWIWKRQFLKKAMSDGGRLSACRWIRISEWVQMGSAKELQEARSGKFVVVFKCSNCSAHTIFDAHGFNDRGNPPKLDKSVLEPLKSIISGSRHKKNTKPPASPVVERPIENEQIEEKKETPPPPQPSQLQQQKPTIKAQPANPKGLHKFLQMKQRSSAAKTQDTSSGGLGDFLLDLNKNKK